MLQLDKTDYITFVNKNKEMIPVYFHPDWLNAVCGNNWIALVYKNKQNIIEAIMPLPYRRFFGKIIFTMPKQTQFLGIWYNIDNFQLYYKQYSKEQEILEAFIARLPKFIMFQLRFSPNFVNSQPFHWQGFKQTNQYSFVLKNIKKHELIFKSFKGNTRTSIRKAEKIVTIEETDDIKTFYEINSLSFKRQQMDIKYSFDLVKKVDDYLTKIDRRKILFAKDEEGKIHAVMYMFYDQGIAYYLWGGANPDLRSSNAQNYLLWEAIKIASERVDTFDFEGSMIKNVASVYKNFNAAIVPYYKIYKTNNFLLKYRQS
jgi:lipid II:glycine glycyltransferase (peptidoglycan interpeptide bridge formation enzyme)